MAHERKTTADFPPKVLDAFDRYVHGFIDRREFLRRAGLFGVGALTAEGLLEALSPNYAEAQEVEIDDPAVTAQNLIYPSPQDWDGYLAKPAKAKGKLPGVLVIHENRGRNPYVEDVARRLAKSGFLAIAPDALTSFGGWPGNDDEGRKLQRQLDMRSMFENWVSAFRYLKSRPDSNGKVGAVGFCYGGGVVNALATYLPDLAAGVPFYGRPANTEDVPKIKASLMIHNGELDKRLMAAAPAYEEALRNANVDFQSFVYPGAHHGFHNYSTPRYDEESASLAWQRTISFFTKHLS
jgi:carboxymethylenebutenolidase